MKMRMRENLFSTKTEVYRYVDLVEVKRICMTQMINEVIPKPYFPICLVPYENKLFYIVDGNHRFAYFQKQNPNIHQIKAWIINETDRKRLGGDPIPDLLQRFRDGELSYLDLCRTARDQGLSIQNELNVLDKEETSEESIKKAVADNLVRSLKMLGYEVRIFKKSSK